MWTRLSYSSTCLLACWDFAAPLAASRCHQFFAPAATSPPDRCRPAAACLQDRSTFAELVAIVVDFLRQEVPECAPTRPIYLLGESFGGLLSLAVAAGAPHSAAPRHAEPRTPALAAGFQALAGMQAALVPPQPCEIRALCPLPMPVSCCCCCCCCCPAAALCLTGACCPLDHHVLCAEVPSLVDRIVLVNPATSFNSSLWPVIGPLLPQASPASQPASPAASPHAPRLCRRQLAWLALQPAAHLCLLAPVTSTLQIPNELYRALPLALAPVLGNPINLLAAGLEAG